MNNFIHNYDVFNYFLEYLSMQDKLILHNANIGFKYKKFRIHSKYAKYCCTNCNNDNLIVIYGLCNDCIINTNDVFYEEFNFNTTIYIDDQTILENYLNVIFPKCKLHYIIYDAYHQLQRHKIENKYFYLRNDIHNFIMDSYFYKKGLTTKLDILIYFHKKQLYIARKNKKTTEITDSIYSTYSKSFINYIGFHFIFKNFSTHKSNIDNMFVKFNNIVDKLSNKNLKLYKDSKIIYYYIKNNEQPRNFLENMIVEEIEEMNYLYTKTRYRKCKSYSLEYRNMIRANIFAKEFSIKKSDNILPSKWIEIAELFCCQFKAKSITPNHYLSLTNYYHKYNQYNNVYNMINKETI